MRQRQGRGKLKQKSLVVSDPRKVDMYGASDRFAATRRASQNSAENTRAAAGNALRETVPVIRDASSEDS